MILFLFFASLIFTAESWGPKVLRVTHRSLSASSSSEGSERENALVPEDTSLVFGTSWTQPIHSHEWLQELMFMPDSLRDFAGGFQDLFVAASDEASEYMCIGEDCEECAIPESYKVAAAQSDINVVEYLGIQRAQPLRKQSWDLALQHASCVVSYILPGE